MVEHKLGIYLAMFKFGDGKDDRLNAYGTRNHSLVFKRNETAKTNSLGKDMERETLHKLSTDAATKDAVTCVGTPVTGRSSYFGIELLLTIG